MFDRIPTYIHINLSFFILLFSAIIAGLLSYYLYRRTVPPISKLLQIVLGLIRGLTMACIILLLFTPEVNIIWQKGEKADVVFLIDKSASMGLTDGNNSRIEKAKDIADKLVSAIGNRLDMRFYAFDSDTTSVFISDIDTTNLGTNLEQAVTTISNSTNPAPTIILLTDGNYTLGNNPLYSDFINQSKIYCIGIGDTVTIPDLMITDVKANKYIYQHQRTEFQVYIKAEGVSAQRIPVSLVHEGKVLAVKDVVLGENGQTTEVNFEVTPQKYGTIPYTVQLNILPEETIKGNNRYTFAVDVLKGKIQVGLIAVNPDYDLKFFRYLLNDIEDVHLHSSIQTIGGKVFFSQPQTILDSLDVMIVYNYHLQSLYDQRARDIIDRLNTRRIPVLVVSGKKISDPQSKIYQELLPLKLITNSPLNLETQVQPTIDGEISPLVNIFETNEMMRKFWSICPPIDYIYSEISFTSPGTIVLETVKETVNEKHKMPVLITWATGNKKSIFLLGSGFWRWHFMLADDPLFSSSWKLMLRNMIRWLDSDVSDKNVTISLPSKKYQIGDNVILNTQVYDGSFKPVNDALIRMHIQGPRTTFEIESRFLQQGLYEESFVPISPGKYRILAEAWRNDLKIGEDTKELYVRSVNKEFLHTDQNVQLLRKLSAKTGAHYFSENNAFDVIKFLNFKPIIVRETETIEIWNRIPFLIIIVVLLCLEWFIRKRKGLA